MYCVVNQPHAISVQPDNPCHQLFRFKKKKEKKRKISIPETEYFEQTDRNDSVQKFGV